VLVKDSNELARIIRENDVIAFDEMFPTKDALLTYRDDKPPFGNIVHVLAEFGNPNFAKRVCNFFTHKYGDEFNALLMEKDMNGDIPAKAAFKRAENMEERAMEITTYKEKEALLAKSERVRHIATFLKYQTEHAYLPQNENLDYTEMGPKYEYGYPLETV